MEGNKSSLRHSASVERDYFGIHRSTLRNADEDKFRPTFLHHKSIEFISSSNKDFRDVRGKVVQFMLYDCFRLKGRVEFQAVIYVVD